MTGEAFRKIMFNEGEGYSEQFLALQDTSSFKKIILKMSVLSQFPTSVNVQLPTREPLWLSNDSNAKVSSSPQVTDLCSLLKHAAHGSKNGLTFYATGKDSTISLSYKQLLELATANATRILQIEGLNAESIVLLHFDNNYDNIIWFWSVILAGVRAAISTPFVANLDQRKSHLSHLDQLFNNPIVLTNEILIPSFLGQLNPRSTQQLIASTSVTSVSQLATYPPRADNIAVLMLTSGSSGHSKAVPLGHTQMLTAIEGKSKYHTTSDKDHFMNWVGLDHVAHLTELHLHGMKIGVNQLQVPASEVLVNPLRFFELIEKHKVTYAFGPNFFLAALRQALEAAPEKTFDLSSLRVLGSGGEATVIETCVALTKLLRRHGVAPGDFIRPGFGMTETCAGISYDKACPSYDHSQGLEFSSLGDSLEGSSMRIAGEDGTLKLTGEVGLLQVTGPVIFKGYYNNPEANAKSFTKDGWFTTGDTAFIDRHGYLNLVGRAREDIIINGVKYQHHELETAIEDAGIVGLVPYYSAVFTHRPKGSQTEVLCVVYLPSYDSEDAKARTEAFDTVSKVCGLVCRARPYKVIPLTVDMLPKSTLGKLSRTKIRSAFEAGEYDKLDQENLKAIEAYRQLTRKAPENETEKKILSLLVELFNFPEDQLSADVSLFDIGVSSIELIRFKHHLEKKVQSEVPLTSLLINPTVRGMANAIHASEHVRPYNPVVVLQEHGPKTPLWMIHPGVGEILVFLNLAKYFNDRPIYALRAKGFEKGEGYFESMDEIITTYYKRMKEVQPHGPYAIAGYSFGAILAFEIGKILEADGEEVKFCGSLNLPPHIKRRMVQLDKIEGFLNLAYFLGFVPESYVAEASEKLHKMSLDEVLDHILALAPPGRLEELSLDRVKLINWGNIAYSIQKSSINYEPSGKISNIDVFYAIPLANLGLEKEEWREKHLSKWAEFSDSEPRYHSVDGAHYTLMDADHVFSFQKKLKLALAERGI
jgi:acyl-CoA synthetase (AMP-forming)/AMP-acid ligase II/thioesterase domain-containing protein/acyl carrier protein